MKLKDINVKEALDDIAHYRLHIEGLSHYYPDLKIVRAEEGSVDYYAASINPACNEVDFTSQTPSTYVTVYFGLPYKEIDIGCKMCSDPIRVNSIPSQIPLYSKHGTTYSDVTKAIYAHPFDEYMKRHKISKYVINKTRSHILDLLKKEPLGEYEEIVLTNSISRLMIFT